MRGTKTEIAPGKWRLRVYIGRRPDGSPIQVSRTVYGGVRAADRELASMVSAASKGKLNGGSESVQQLLDFWVEHCEDQGHSPTTIREYRRIAEKIVKPRLGKLTLRKLDARHLDALYKELRGKGLAPASIRRVHALMSASLRYAEKKRMVESNVARLASPPPARQEPVKAPSPKEVRALVTAAEKDGDTTTATLILVAALTGVRRGELCALRWTDVDWAAETLTVARSVYQRPGGSWGEKGTKTHQERRIGLDPVASEALRRRRREMEALAAELGLDLLADGFVFSRSPQGKTPLMPDFVTKLVVGMARGAGVDTHLHALRHFMATQAISGGFDPVTVSQRLGHADPSVTLRVYAHAVEQRDRDLALALGAQLGADTSQLASTK
jgi:integrase